MTKGQIAAIAVVLLLGVVFLCGCTVVSRNRRKSRQSRDRCQRPEKIRCPMCGAEAKVTGKQWECPWCGDSGWLK